MTRPATSNGCVRTWTRQIRMCDGSRDPALIAKGHVEAMDGRGVRTRHSHAFPGRQITQELADDLPGLRERRLRVRIVAAPEQVVDADVVPELDAYPVLLERDEHVAAKEVAGERPVGEGDPPLLATALRVVEIHALHEMGRP